MGIDLSFSSAFHPQTNGQTERTNQTLETYLRCFVSADQDDWVSFLPLAEFALNNLASSATLVSPFFCNSGFHPRFSSGQVESSDCPGVDTVVDRLQQIWTHVVDNLTLSQEKAQRFANRRCCVGPRLRVGDSFSIHNVFHRPLLRRYVAPMVPSVDPPAPVLVEGELEYIVEKILDSRVSRRKLQYLVKWKGYAQEDNSWVFASDVHAPDLVRAFHMAHPGRPGGSDVGNEAEGSVHAEYGRVHFDDLVPSPTSEKAFLAQIHARKPTYNHNSSSATGNIRADIVPEDAYNRHDDETYENDSVRQLENELKMEEYLKQKLPDEAYQFGFIVWGRPAHPPRLSQSVCLSVFRAEMLQGRVMCQDLCKIVTRRPDSSGISMDVAEQRQHQYGCSRAEAASVWM
ncbi:unnamed protein product [Ranitomeya imitator]|uniref:Polyprotein n=1 Tax=Ranitomeya imitator TaxID=111125 RepID=A0ABN9KVK9_9NEOB|nr:unnamed protein product [Ranitomeya imitator]